MIGVGATGTSPDLVALAATARDAGQAVALITRTAPGASSLVGIGSRYEIVADGSGAALEDPSGRRLDAEPGPDPLRAAGCLWARLSPRLGQPGPRPGAGPVAIGGFAYDPTRPGVAPWEGFGGLLLRVPALAVATIDGLTSIWGDQDLLHATPLQRAPAAHRLAVTPSLSPEAWMVRVAAASARLRAGEAAKVVLAREVVARGEGVLAAARVAAQLRHAYPECFTYLVTGGDGSTFVGASPELLVRRQGTGAESEPMAGSTARGDDEAADRELAAALLRSGKDHREHELVARHVVAALERIALSVQAGAPQVARLPNIQHLATRIRAKLPDPAPSVLELAAALHPTPAINGHPGCRAAAMIRELEGMERGWYAGGVGWVDARGDGEVAIAIRCGLLWEDAARLYAGNGMMPESDPAQELRETELKLRPLLEALVG